MTERRLEWRSLNDTLDAIAEDADDREALYLAVERLQTAGLMFLPLSINRAPTVDAAFHAARLILEGRPIWDRARPFFHSDDDAWVDTAALQELLRDQTISDTERMKLQLALNLLDVHEQAHYLDLPAIIGKLDAENWGRFLMAIAVRRQGLTGSTI